ncbi:unnamed protein product [Periconia digitata]|uniref:Uncharacterized protein n=1 Tax=Periconia digitata TaxID=1303443 RepID=A0A9W4UHR9_9PLEO|nr:unnamed protein product [Periconia digitata]
MQRRAVHKTKHTSPYHLAHPPAAQTWVQTLSTSQASPPSSLPIAHPNPIPISHPTPLLTHHLINIQPLGTELAPPRLPPPSMLSVRLSSLQLDPDQVLGRINSMLPLSISKLYS